MSRKNYTHRQPQRSRFSSNQELRAAVRAEKPKAFGIRRRLEYQDDITVRDDFYDLLIDNSEVAELIDPRTMLQVTIMPRKQLDSQLNRGIIVGYEFGKQVARIQQGIKESQPNRITVDVGQPRVIKHGRAVVLAVSGEQLFEESRATLKAMASMGLRGALRSDNNSRPHITLGESRKPLTAIEKQTILEVVREMPIIGKSVTLEPLEFYSGP